MVRYTTISAWWQKLTNRNLPEMRQYSDSTIPIALPPRYPNVLSPGGGVEGFDTPEAAQLNRARMEHLQSLDLPLLGKTVLDVGCGVGHLAQAFVKLGCDVLCIDGRKENIDRLRSLYPNLKACVYDVETDPLSDLGLFDVVFAYGLLYHLENPFQAIRKLASVCKDLLLLETMVTDHHLPVVLMREETSSYNQALQGIGSRPSPSFVVMALKAVGFEHIYAPCTPPDHPDFRFEWKDDLSDARDGHLLRCVFIGSRGGLSARSLIDLLQSSLR